MSEKQEYLVYRGESQDRMYRAHSEAQAAEHFASKRGQPGETITVKQRGTNSQWKYIIGEDVQTGEIYASPVLA